MSDGHPADAGAHSPAPPRGLQLLAAPPDAPYEFEAPQFYDFTKASDPERPAVDEHWFGRSWPCPACASPL